MKTKFAIGTYNPDGTPKTKKSKRRNMTYRKKLTKYRQAKLNKELLIVFSIWIISIPIVALFQYKNEIKIDGPADKVSAVYAIAEREEVEVAVADTSISELPLREITMYNAGDPNQCDSTPCISASGDNICNLLAKGVKICAANFVPLGTKLEIQNYGECVVLDRMNSRFKNRVDIAAEAHEKPRAIKFGLQHLAVKIVK